MKPRISNAYFIGITLFLLACIVGVLQQRPPQQTLQIPRAQYTDSTPLGGKGFRLLLEHQEYRTHVTREVLSGIPDEAKIWVLLDPETSFSAREAEELLAWVENGGILIWAVSFKRQSRSSTGVEQLRKKLETMEIMPPFHSPNEPLPQLFPLEKSAVSEIWTDVSQAQASSGVISIQRPHLALSQLEVGLQLAQIPYGKGKVFAASDALMFTNYALSKPDNAVLASNLIRLHAQTGALIVFDERTHGESQTSTEKNWVYYLWQPPLRYALFQLVAALLLAAFLYGRRFGTPVPLPDRGPITRASQFALAMGALFQKAGRPQAADKILREEFRLELVRRLGLSIADPSELIAQRAAELTEFPAREILQLLQTSPEQITETEALKNAQKMDRILRSFNR